MTSKEQIFRLISTAKPELQSLGIRNIGIFGSYVRGEQTKTSDIDILIDFEPEKENYDNDMAVYDIIERLFLNERVEIVSKNGLSPYIDPKILSEVLYV